MARWSRIQTKLEGLRDTFGEFPVEEATNELSAARSQRVLELHERGVLGGARVWVQREDEALLVRENSRPDSWGVAGGLIEPDETVEEAGHREVREETGIECSIHDVAYVHLAEYTLEGTEMNRIKEIASAFVACYEQGTISVQEDEISEARWFTTPPENIHSPADRIGADRLDWKTD